MRAAILIGVSNYFSVKNINASKNDVNVINRILMATGLYETEHILIIDENTIKTEIIEKIKNFKETIKKCDLKELFFYFSGHGYYDTIEEEFYYFLSDSDGKNYTTTSFNNKEMDSILKNFSAELLIKMVDACNSGMSYIKELEKASCWSEENQEEINKSIVSQINSFILKTSKELENVVFLFSSHKDQSSIALSNISVFTKSFILALNEGNGYEVFWSEIIDKISKFFLNIEKQDQQPYFVTQCGPTFFCEVNESLKRIIEKFVEPIKKEFSNPFKYLPPEGLTLQDYKKIFVKESSEIEQIKRNQDNIIIGSQGSGKSMLLLYLEITHQLSLNNCSFPQFFNEKINDFLGILIHVVNDRLKVAYYENLSDNEFLDDSIINSICMTDIILVIVSTILITFTQWPIKDYLNSLDKESIINFYEQVSKLINSKEVIDENQNNFQIFKTLEEKISKIRDEIKYFCLKRLTNENTDYSLPSYDHRFLDIFIKEFKELFKVKDIPLYILIDNADYGCRFTYKCFNDLIRIRHQKDYCFKFAVQRGKLWDLDDLDDLNDYHLFIIDEINTNDNSVYLKKIERITETRLKINGININGYEFFPIHKREEDLYNKIVKDMRKELSREFRKLPQDKKKGTEDRYIINRISKYARSRLFRECKPNNYSYVGFKNLIQISSGVVRQFLRLTSLIFDKELALILAKGEESVNRIGFSSQNEGIKEFSDQLLESRTIRKIDNKTDDQKKISYSGLFNLIEGLGTYFNQRFYDKEKIRECIFSFRITGEKSEKTEEIIDLGLSENMFQTKLISSSGKGTKIIDYSLNRGLCPRYGLDLFFKSRVSFNDKEILSAIETGKTNRKSPQPFKQLDVWVKKND